MTRPSFRRRISKQFVAIAVVLCGSVSAEILYGYGGECVEYARSQMVAMGFNVYQMPTLCQFDPNTCGAYLIYEHWNMGFGKGAQPAQQSLMVIARDTGVSVGHVAIVQKVSDNGDGTKLLVGTDSNAHGNHMTYTDVHWVFDQTNMRARRENGPWHPVLGFVYSQPKPGTGGNSATDAIIGNCLAKFSAYFGSREGQAFDSGNFRLQLTAGGPRGEVRAIAVQREITPLYIWYWWYGWHTLQTNWCY